MVLESRIQLGLAAVADSIRGDAFPRSLVAIFSSVDLTFLKRLQDPHCCAVFYEHGKLLQDPHCCAVFYEREKTMNYMNA